MLAYRTILRKNKEIQVLLAVMDQKFLGYRLYFLDVLNPVHV